MRVRTAAVVILVLSLLLAGCVPTPTIVAPGRPRTAATSPTDATFFSTGTVRVPGRLDPHNSGVPGVCVADARWADIKYGASVVVTDTNGRRAAAAALDYGRYDAAGAFCTFGFSLGSLTDTGGSFKVHVGKATRPAITFTPRQMAEGPEIRFTD